MPAQREKLTIEMRPPTTRKMSQKTIDDAIHALAKLIGRQIAREQFEQLIERERKALARRSDDG